MKSKHHIKTHLVLAAFSLGTLLPIPAHGAAKKREQKQTDRKVSSRTAAPSERIEPLLDKTLEAIFSSLKASPKMPRVEIEKLRASFSGELIKATTQEQRQILQNAMAVCDSLTKCMDDRANAKAAAEASAKTPLNSNATSIHISSPMRGRDAGAAGEAIRKKLKDERKDADDVARREAAFLQSVAYRSWTEGAPTRRRAVMANFTRQVQLEALEERNAAIAAQAAQSAQAAEAAKAAQAAKAEAAAKIAAADRAAQAANEEKATKAKTEAKTLAAAAEKVAKAAKAEAAAKAADAEKAESARQSLSKSLAEEKACVGIWASRAGKKTLTVKDDHTAIKKVGDEETNGAWKVVEGEFRLHWEEGNVIRAKLSEDGQRIEARGQEFVRQKS